MKVLSLVNQKGGVAKTTTSIALADYFSRHGKNTLLIDFDPQGSLTTSFGLADDPNEPQALKLLALERGGPEATLQKCAKNLYIITSDIGLEKANATLITKIGKERYLRRAIDELNKKEKFDYVILDSNPSFSQLTINVLYASDRVLVPFKPEYNSYKGIIQLFDNIEELKALRPDLDVLGFVVTMARPVKSAEQAIAEITEFAKNQNCRVFTPAIRLAVACADAPSHGKSIYSYAPDSNVARDYEMLGANVLEALEGN